MNTRQNVSSFSDSDQNLTEACRRNLHMIVCSIAGARTLSREDIEDCTQECFIRFWSHYGSTLALSEAMTKNRGWIVVCTKHHVINYCRALRRRRERENELGLSPSTVATGQTHDAIVIRKELIGHIQDCAQKLQTDQWTMIMRHYIHGETCAEIADSLGVATNVLEQRLLRSRRKLFKICVNAGITEEEVTDYIVSLARPFCTLNVARVLSDN